MIPIIVIYVALISISLMIALILAVAWHEFGRPRHALTWATAFGITGVMWALALATGTNGTELDAMAPPTLILAGLASALNTLGFRQRAGMSEGRAGLLAAAGTHALVVIVLSALHAVPAARAMPLSLLNAVLFWLAARTLTGRRKGERVAARAAQGGLFVLSLLNLTFLVGLLGTLFGMPLFDLQALGWLTTLLLPTIVTVIGLFTVILLAADLADQARRLAGSDMLTGLLNRRGFDEAARAVVASAGQKGGTLALVLIDLDRFKDVNDRFGHPAGDEVLCTLAQRIAGGIDRRDIFARIGGEEFALMMVDADLASATLAADRLRQSVATMQVDLPEPYQITASFGVAVPRHESEALPSLFKRADEALYRAKAEGRNRVVAAP